VQADSGIELSKVRWRQVENIFIAVFCVELFLRLFWIGLKGMVKDPWAWFDFVIVFMSAFDNFYMSPLPKQLIFCCEVDASGSQTLPGLSVLRVIRLARLARIVRLLKLCKELNLLAGGLMASLRELFWTLLMLFICLYVFAIVGVDLISRDPVYHGTVVEGKFANIFTSMWTLLRLATLDDWADIMNTIISKRPMLCPVIGLFMGLSTLGLLNLIVGIMCASAMLVTKRDDHVGSLRTTVRRHKALMELRAVLQHRKKPGPTDTWGEQELLSFLQDYPALHRELTRTGLTEDALEAAFVAIDMYMPKGHVTSDEFIGTLMVFSSDLRSRFLDFLELESLIQLLTLDLERARRWLVAFLEEMELSILRSVPWNDQASAQGKMEFHKLLLRVKMYQAWLVKGKHGKHCHLHHDHAHDHLNPHDSPVPPVKSAETVETVEPTNTQTGQGDPLPVTDEEGDDIEEADEEEGEGDADELEEDAPAGEATVDVSPPAPQPSAREPLIGAEDATGACSADAAQEVQHGESAASMDSANSTLFTALPSFHSADAADEAEEDEEEDDDDDRQDRAMTTMASFDSFFAIFLVLNMILIGVQVDDSLADTDHKTAWWLGNSSLTLVFTVELFLRLLLLNQVYRKHDYTLSYYFFPAFPHAPRLHAPPPGHEGEHHVPTAIQAWRRALFGGWERLRRDAFGMFDLTIVIFCISDDFILSFIEGSFSPRIIGIIRVIRLIKVTRIGRSMRLTMALFLLTEQLVKAYRSVFWAVMLLLIKIYVTSIIILTLLTGNIRKNPQHDPTGVLLDRYEHLGDCMWIQLRLATLDGWLDILNELMDDGWYKMALFVAMVTAYNALGIMNLIVGVMCESAIEVRKSFERHTKQLVLKGLRHALASVKKRFDQGIGGHKALSRSNLSEALKDKKLTSLFAAAQLQLADVWAIFDQMSMGSSVLATTDSVVLSDFVNSCMRFGQPISSMDVIAAKVQLAALETHYDEVVERTHNAVAQYSAALQMLVHPRARAVVKVNKHVVSFIVEAEHFLANSKKEAHKSLHDLTAKKENKTLWPWDRCEIMKQAGTVKYQDCKQLLEAAKNSSAEPEQDRNASPRKSWRSRMSIRPSSGKGTPREDSGAEQRQGQCSEEEKPATS